MPTYLLPHGGRLVVKRGDLVHEDADAVVNAANPALLGGGGVDGALHAAAGPELLAACRRLPDVDGVRCPTGEARITPGFGLPARFVIHTVGPIHAASADPDAELARAVASSLDLARGHGLRTVALPAISCGVYGFPLHEAAAVLVDAIAGHGHGLDEVRVVLPGAAAFDAFDLAASARLPGPRSPDRG